MYKASRREKATGQGANGGLQSALESGSGLQSSSRTSFLALPQQDRSQRNTTEAREDQLRQNLTKLAM